MVQMLHVWQKQELCSRISTGHGNVCLCRNWSSITVKAVRATMGVPALTCTTASGVSVLPAGR